MNQAAAAAPGWGSSHGHVKVGPPEAVAADTALVRLAVADRIHRYAWAFDERRRNALANCFTDDAVWDGNTIGSEPVPPIHGRDAIADWLAGFWPRQTDQRRHLMLSLVVSNVTADDADALVSLALTAAEEGKIAIVLTSFYRMHLVRHAGIWRIQHLFEGFDCAF